jgi:hypothetical protein
MPRVTSDSIRTIIQEGKELFWDNFGQAPLLADTLFNRKTVTSGGHTQSNSMVGSGVLEERKSGEEHAERAIVSGFPVAGPIKEYAKKQSYDLNDYDDDEKLREAINGDLGMWAKDVDRTKDMYYADLFNKGGFTAGHSIFNASHGNYADASGDFIYDGKPLFALTGNNHTKKNGSTYFNSIAQALSAANLQTAMLQLQDTNAYDEAGQRMRVDNVALVVPSALVPTAKVLTESQLLPGGANNDINVYAGMPYFEWPELDDSDSWFLVSLKHPNGIWIFDRQLPQIWEEVNTDTKTVTVGINARWGHEIRNFTPYLANNLATS